MPDPAIPNPIQVLSTERLHPNNPIVTACHVDTPLPATSSDARTLLFSGWITGPSTFTHVGVYDPQGIELLRAPVDSPRPDVQKVHPKASPTAGFSFPFAITDPGPEITYKLVGFAANQTALTFQAIRFRTMPLPVAPPTILPLLLTSMGRSGSTWVMGLLARHPEIIAHDPHRFDTRVGSYWAGIFAALAQPASSQQSVLPHDLGSDLWWLSGATPANAVMPDPHVARFLGNDHIVAVADFANRRMDAFYQLLAAAENRGTAPKFFVEKYDPRLGRIALRALAPGAKEIILLRDPRDALCSVLAFNKKRGFVSFGRESVQSDEDYIRWYAASLALLKHTFNLPSRPVLSVRYEDLIQDPRPTLRTLLTQLSLDASDAVIDTLLARPDEQTLSYHRTTESPAASIHRWKKDLPPALRPVVRTHLDPLLTAMGYEPTPN